MKNRIAAISIVLCVLLLFGCTNTANKTIDDKTTSNATSNTQPTNTDAKKNELIEIKLNKHTGKFALFQCDFLCIGDRVIFEGTVEKEINGEKSWSRRGLYIKN